MNEKINELYNKLDAQDEIIEQQIEVISINHKQIDMYLERLNKIKEYLKQVHIEQQQGILSSNNLIWDNIVRLCDGLELLGDKK